MFEHLKKKINQFWYSKVCFLCGGKSTDYRTLVYVASSEKHSLFICKKCFPELKEQDKIADIPAKEE